MTFRIVLLALAGTMLCSPPAYTQLEKDRESHGLVDWVIGADSRPLVEFSYGLDQPKQTKFSGAFTGLGFAEGRLGYSTVRPFRPGILELDDRFVYASHSSENIGTFNTAPEAVTLGLWKFGVANRKGFGWDLGPIGLIPFHAYSADLTTVDYTIPQPIAAADSAILGRYPTAARFGHTTEAGVQLALSDVIGINASYQGAVVFPRYVFWEWFCSYLIAGTAVTLISDFGEDIVERSPVLGPIVYFILRNGVAFAAYALWRNNMNWPFHSETPLTHETAKIGVNLTF